MCAVLPDDVDRLRLRRDLSSLVAAAAAAAAERPLVVGVINLAQLEDALSRNFHSRKLRATRIPISVGRVGAECGKLRLEHGERSSPLALGVPLGAFVAIFALDRRGKRALRSGGKITRRTDGRKGAREGSARFPSRALTNAPGCGWSRWWEYVGWGAGEACRQWKGESAG